MTVINPTGSTSVPLFKSMYGLLGANSSDLEATTSIAPSAGFIFCCKVPILVATQVSKAYISVETAGAILTANQCQIGVYSAAGVLLGRNADISGPLASAGAVQAVLTAEGGQTLPTGNPDGTVWVHVAVLVNGTTMPKLNSFPSYSTNPQNDLLVAPNYKFGYFGGGTQTTLPANRGALTEGRTFPFLAGVL